jgi:hypothetical protein
MNSYDMNTIWQVSQKVLSSKIDEEVILMSFEADSYFGIDPVGSRIWELLSEKPASINELVVILVDEYEVDEETCRKQVQIFIDEMYTKKLIIKSD